MQHSAHIIIVVSDLIVADLLADCLGRNGLGVTTVDAQQLPALLAARGGNDAVLLDPDAAAAAGGMEAIVRQAGPSPVILLSGRAQWDSVEEMLEMGVRGYIPKSVSLRTFLNALRLVLAGESYVPADLVVAGGGAAALAMLTEREMEVLAQIRLGRMNREIAQSLGLSLVTVKMHVRTICSKLSARNRTQAALIAAQLLPT